VITLDAASKVSEPGAKTVGEPLVICAAALAASLFKVVELVSTTESEPALLAVTR